MRLRRVYIKRAGGEIASEACYTAWRGFSHLAYPLDFFEWEDLTQKCLRLDPLTLVVGGTVAVHMALRQIGAPVPPPLNLPGPLLGFAGRAVWETTLGAVRERFRSPDASPLFIKPQVETKSFAGAVVTGAVELGRLQHLDDDTRIQTAEPVAFVSEWRYFVHRGAVVGLAHYRGEWSIVPDSDTVRRAVAAYSPGPVACALDFGVTADGRTLLVEANDAFALGAYGLDAVTYARMLEDRWLQVVGVEA
ncbi:ATP-grasp domain-containing protein [Gemmata sp. G18]|uniref:ATP-grasp domain-containing protein n=1 Tax=Gemmata palustris TaxID=2822762 RepID=A0ABS5BR45_9BACT|nr:ATP-grasp domain-containing protein [Gemmata palustris]MBP3956181.1 ATP-grasp domain-containing protein [Gemmata palustris]